jgi:hypothetical protein
MKAAHPSGADKCHIMDSHRFTAGPGMIVPFLNEFGIAVNGF